MWFLDVMIVLEVSNLTKSPFYAILIIDIDDFSVLFSQEYLAYGLYGPRRNAREYFILLVLESITKLTSNQGLPLAPAIEPNLIP